MSRDPQLLFGRLPSSPTSSVDKHQEPRDHQKATSKKDRSQNNTHRIPLLDREQLIYIRIHCLQLEPKPLAYQSLQWHSNSTSIVKRPPQLVKHDVEVTALITFSLGLSGFFLKRPVLKKPLRKVDSERLAVKKLVEHDPARRAVFE